MAISLILIPGLHGTAALFSSFQTHIPTTIPHRVIAYPRDKAMTYRQLVAWLEDQLAGETDLVLLAESFSGAIALHFAAKNPTRVKAVILCASFIRPPVPRIFCYLGAPLAALRFPIPRWAARLFLGGRTASKQLLKQVIREVHSVRPHVIASRVLIASWCDARKPLRHCPAPILCIAGNRDRLLGTRSSRRIQRTRKNVQLRIINGPHLLLQTNPAEAWHEVQNFLETLPAPPTNAPR